MPIKKQGKSNKQGTGKEKGKGRGGTEVLEEQHAGGTDNDANADRQHVETSTSLRLKGNDMFSENKFEEALQLYERALEQGLQEKENADSEKKGVKGKGEASSETAAVDLSPIYCNLSGVYLKLEQYDVAQDYAVKAIKEAAPELYLKAFHRAALACSAKSKSHHSQQEQEGESQPQPQPQSQSQSYYWKARQWYERALYGGLSMADRAVHNGPVPSSTRNASGILEVKPPPVSSEGRKFIELHLRRLKPRCTEEYEKAPVNSREQWREMFAHIDETVVRLATMATGWNVCTEEERFALYKRLMYLMGGKTREQEVERYYKPSQMIKLSMQNYEHVPVNQQWLEFFNSLDSSEKLECFEDMFEVVTQAQKDLIMVDMSALAQFDQAHDNAQQNGKAKETSSVEFSVIDDGNQ